MEKCKEFRKKIFWEELSEEQQQRLKKHLESCAECRQYFERNEAILSSLQKSNVHISGELLNRYTSYLYAPDEPDYDGRRLSKTEISRMQKHLRQCRSCEQKLADLKAEFQDLQAFIDNSELPDLTIDRRSFQFEFLEKVGHLRETVESILNAFFSSLKPKYVLIPATGLAVLLALVLIIPSLERSGDAYSELAALEKTEISYLTRSSTTTSLRSGIAEFNQANYSSAIEILTGFIRENPEDANIAYPEYVCGLAYLFEANQSTGDELSPPQHRKLERGIAHLQTALSSSDNLRLRENANWYLGKAYLMKKDARTAREFFEKVSSLKGQRYQQAQMMLNEIEKILISEN